MIGAGFGAAVQAQDFVVLVEVDHGEEGLVRDQLVADFDVDAVPGHRHAVAAESQGQAANCTPAVARPQSCEGMTCAIDVGSTTCKYVLESPAGTTVARGYERHHTRQAEKVLDFLVFLETRHGLCALRDRIFLTGSGCGTFLPHFLQVRRASSFQKSFIA